MRPLCIPARLCGLLPKLSTLVRSALTGGAATIVDLALIALAVGLFGIPARLANVPALLAGAAVQFLGNRHYAFRATGGSLRRQAALFAATELVAIGLNAALYHVAIGWVAAGTLSAVAVRAVTTNLVFLLWSYPAWCRVFRVRASAEALR